MVLASVAIPLAVLLTGCSFVPKSKLDECHNVSVTLRAENTRLKDVALDLRAQNQDLTQRAVDDSRKLAAQEEAVTRLEKSVTAYQAERDKLAAAFETIKRQVRLSASPQPSAALGEGLGAFIAAHPGWTFDAQAGTLLAPSDRLFEPDSSRLKARAGDDLDALAAALKDAVAGGQVVEVAGRAGPAADEVRKTAFEADHDGAETAAQGRFLATSRAARVREALVRPTRLDAGRVRLAPPRESDAPATADRVELRLVRRDGGLDVDRSVDK
jgi:outer membrane protein OmpA-like peptidoglycan-associated protein